MSRDITWWARQDSNLHLTDYESAALTIELRAHQDRRAAVAGRCDGRRLS